MDFNSQQYWAERYAKGGDSGAGSKNHLSMFKAKTIRDIIRRFFLKSIAELGCGDGMQVKEMIPFFQTERVKYDGFDISQPLIWSLREKFKNQETIVNFFSMSQLSEKYEATISMDVIYHLVEDKVFEDYMAKLFDHSSKVVIIYSSNHEDNEGSAAWVRHRRFDTWVTANRPEWKLFQLINNPWPYSKGMSPKKSRNTSVSNFYIYVKH